ncbi:tetratricopeptide repeat protein [Acidiphilium sp.]|uniref:tetratricopeptide repeat-containing glycosyltransferase family protein n=1 Tax=Acidiphilium sp. TaxID=527 RepID=UPI003D00217C
MDQIVADCSPDMTVSAAEQHYQAGLAAYRAGRFNAALDHFSAVIAILPGFYGALVNRALTYWSLGALHDAELDAAAACEAKVESAEVWMIAGALKLERGDGTAAVDAYHCAATLRPDLAGAQAGLAAAYLALGQYHDAQDAAVLALAMNPTLNHAKFTLGSVRSALGDLPGAIALFDQILAAEPDHAGALLNRGNARINLDQIEAGERDLRAAVACDPALKEAWTSLAVTRTICGDLATAIEAADRAIELDPDYAVAHWNRGVSALLGGDFTAGFAAYEWRKRHPIYGRQFDRLPAPSWTGEDLAGKHLLVRAEQGLGDTIMFARFLPMLAQQAARLTLACHPTLFPLFTDMGIGLCGLDDAAPAHVDLAIDQMSLPHVLGLTAETIPGAGGYLMPPRRVPRPAVPRKPGQRLIGLTWAGNPGHNNDRRRSLPPCILAPILALPDTGFVALQLGARRDEYDIPSLAPIIGDFGTSADCLAELDALVTVDTSIAHLAGAMGVECHILLSASCDWRWLLGRTTTPWYNSVTLHRQSRLGDWSAPIASVIAALQGAALPSPRSAVVMPPV